MELNTSKKESNSLKNPTSSRVSTGGVKSEEKDFHHPPDNEQDKGNENMTTNQQTNIEAASVYVMMKKSSRVSRNIRACWFFKHLHKSFEFTPLDSLSDFSEELTLVSVIPTDPEVRLETGQTYQVHIVPDTNVTFLSSTYKLCFTLDLSPSLMSVDVQIKKCVFDGVFQSLSTCLKALVKPFEIPGSCIKFSPDLYISVICQTPVVCSSTNQALIQGVKLNQDNVEHYLTRIGFELDQFESALAHSFGKLLHLQQRKESFLLDEEEEDSGSEFNIDDHMGNPEEAFTNLLRYGILSLQLLPDNSSSGIVVITDGVVGIPSGAMLEMLLNQLRNHTIMVSFIKVGSLSSLYRRLAHLPHIELMQTIATATFGAYVSSTWDVSAEVGEANLYHKAMFFWSFQRGLEGFKYDLTYCHDLDMPGSIAWIRKMLFRHPITDQSYGLENIRRESDKRKVIAGLHSVLSVRLREGYTIKSVMFVNENKEILVKLHFPWRDYGKIEYSAKAAWPLDSAVPITYVEVHIEGIYDLIHEMVCRPENDNKSFYRSNNIKTLWRILDKISMTDKMLEHLQSFSSQLVYYNTPESIRSGVPLFNLQQDGPSINMQLSGSEIEKFASYWKDVFQLDTNNWQKWLHSHRISLVLEHDRQFPQYFQVPNASSRFSSIQCRQALASLSMLLREWSTFTLAENHSYIKILQHEQDKPPRFFCVLRLTANPPLMIIRLGFLGGTPTSLRYEEIRLLTHKISTVSFPQRGSQKSAGKSTSSSTSDLQEELNRPHKSPLNREGSEIACCVLLTKPVEKILVVYESKPRDMTVVKEAVREDRGQQQQAPMWSLFRTITHYLQHQRWVWSVQSSPRAQIGMSAISRMLSTLTKIRLQEGFHFASSGAGVTNLVLEVDMKGPENESDVQKCVVQYVIFPPHSKTVDDTVSEDEQEESDMVEADGEVQIVTECWVEPQYGLCYNNSPERQHFNQLTYEDITKVFYPIDHACVSCLVTYEHLVYLCENKTIPSPDPGLTASRHSSPPSTPLHQQTWTKEESIRSEPTVNFIPFPFDLQTILPYSQQAEMLFSTFTLGLGHGISGFVDRRLVYLANYNHSVAALLKTDSNSLCCLVQFSSTLKKCVLSQAR